MFGKNLNLSPTEIIFLLILKMEKSLTGSQIVQRITDQLGEDWKPTPGATYKILQSLQSKEFILDTTNYSERKDQRKKTYSISELGDSSIPEVSSRFNKVMVFMNDCVPGCCEGTIIKIQTEGKDKPPKTPKMIALSKD